MAPLNFQYSRLFYLGLNFVLVCSWGNDQWENKRPFDIWGIACNKRHTDYKNIRFCFAVQYKGDLLLSIPNTLLLSNTPSTKQSI